MAVCQQLEPIDRASITDRFDALIAQSGSGAHPYVLSGQLFHGQTSARNLADAVHYLSALHGHVPGLFDHARAHVIGEIGRSWIDAMAAAFSGERSYLARLASACGPVPAAPNQSAFETALAAHRRAIDLLGQSERHGTAMGASLALALEWYTLRALLDRAAERIDFHTEPAGLPPLKQLSAAADDYDTDGSSERAMMFGARQLVTLHHAMWDVLAARAASHARR